LDTRTRIFSVLTPVTLVMLVAFLIIIVMPGSANLALRACVLPGR
jgi:hypothetical protein